jgi:hypothetical protein
MMSTKSYESVSDVKRNSRSRASFFQPKLAISQETAFFRPGNPTGIQRQMISRQEDMNEEWFSLPDMVSGGEPSMDTAYAKMVRFEGKTDATFDGGTGQTKNLKAKRAASCEDCSGDDCLTITGTFEITYTVTTSVTLPDMPDDLTPCQQSRVQDAIDNKIAPHEQQHVKAFNTYNGVKNLPINYTGCKAGLQDYLQGLNDADGIPRRDAAKAKSAKLDPFYVNVDLDCKD